MKVRGNIKPLVVGIAVGLIPAVIMATNIVGDSPKVERYQPKWDTSFMTYAGGVVDDKTERFYQRGKDWIIIKDFPENIDNHSLVYKKISDILWSN